MSKKRGRPKGAANNEVDGIVVIVPPGCPACRGSNYARVDGSKTLRRDIDLMRDGMHMTKRETRRMKCECGQIFFEIRYIAKQ